MGIPTGTPGTVPTPTPRQCPRAAQHVVAGVATPSGAGTVRVMLSPLGLAILALLTLAVVAVALLPALGPRLTSRDLSLVAIFSGVIAALGLVPAVSPFGGAVPITAQSMGIMLAGAVLGARRGALSVLLFLGLVAVGLPLLAGGRGGLGVFAGPSVGYLVGFPVAAWLIGRLTEKVGRPYKVTLGTMANILGGVLALNVLGVIGMSLVLGISLVKATILAAAFLPGDLVKAVLTALVARGVHAAYPGLIPARRDRSAAPDRVTA